jgi:hypothetical protein
MTDDEDTVTVEEIKRQTVVLVFSVLGAVALVTIGALEHDATSRARVVMRTALTVKRVAQWNADVWGSLALKAGTVYNRYRD